MTGQTVETMQISDGGADLAGTLRLPAGAGPFPAGLIVADRDDPPDPVWPAPAVGIEPDDLATRLTAAGLASLRYDRRLAAGDRTPVDLDTATDDARAAWAALRQDRRVAADRLGLIGLGEGALIAARIAGRDPAVRRLVLIGPPVDPLDRRLIARAEAEAAAIADLSPAERFAEGIPADFDPVRVVLNLIEVLSAAPDPVVTIGGQAYPTDWFRQHLRTDPIAVYRRVRCPTLVVTVESGDGFPLPEGADRPAGLARARSGRAVDRIVEAMRGAGQRAVAAVVVRSADDLAAMVARVAGS